MTTAGKFRFAGWIGLLIAVASYLLTHYLITAHIGPPPFDSSSLWQRMPVSGKVAILALAVTTLGGVSVFAGAMLAALLVWVSRRSRARQVQSDSAPR